MIVRPYETHIAFRFLLKGRGQTLLLLGGIAVGVAVQFFLSALIGGLQASLIERTVGSTPHIYILPPDRLPTSVLAEEGAAVDSRRVPYSEDTEVLSWQTLKGRGNYLNKQFVARAIADADALFSLAHFKGHPAGGYGAAIKNIGLGCASKRGKMNLHGALAGDKPVIKPELCPGQKCEWWQTCEECCPEGSIKVTEKGLEIDLDSCVYCFACANLSVNMDGVNGIQRFDFLPTLGSESLTQPWQTMMTKEPGRTFFINYAMDITPACDCYGWTDTPFVNGIGVFASYDPVAVDKACIDLMNQAPGLINSEAEEFDALAPGSKKLNLIKGKDIEVQVYGGTENGLGTIDYVIEHVPLDRSQAAIAKFYPEGVRAKRLRPMYEKNHPLSNLDTAC